ncbi:tRNA (adenosine(37)-N6)-dimethylallyltransferase MiaA [Salinarimonas sp.]|uniref:tRNA (adenosine(37)-N6)-dimethylallyltransferase MiaA n=1 Tax=Salinarimonas sp. TaxID=2766526 RepID=UPI00391B11D5
MEPQAVLIAGPTASGKSALALSLAERVGGVVIDADSMQVYRDLRVLTARPSPEEEARVPHDLYGFVDGAENYSVARYVEDARAAIARARETGRLPILCGGTGLYFKALTHGLSDIPPVPEAVRARVRAACEGIETPALHARLAAQDPLAAARLRPSDRLRVMRALEVFAATGRSLLSFHGERVPGPLADAPLVRLFLAPARESVRARIDARFLAMMEAGALDEVRALAARGLDPMLPVMRAHGVPGLIAHLEGRATIEEAIARGQADTRAYAKRQATFFRNTLPEFPWIAPEAAEDWLRERVGAR